MAFTESNRMTRQNISKLVQNIATMKSGQAGRLHETGLQKKQLAAQEKEGRRNRLSGLLQTGLGIAGNIGGQALLARQSENLAEKRVTEGSPFYEYQVALEDRAAALEQEQAKLEAQLRSEGAERQSRLESGLRMTEEKTRLGKGGVFEQFNIRGEARGEAATERAAEAEAERRRQEAADLRAFQKRLLSMETQEERDAATKKFERDKELADIEWRRRRKEVATTFGQAQELQEDRFAGEKELIEWKAKNNIELYTLRKMRDEPGLMETFLQMNPGRTPEEVAQFSVVAFIEGGYFDYVADAEARGQDVDKEGFKAWIDRRVRGDASLYGEQFVMDVASILPEYIDFYFQEQEGGGGTTTTPRQGITIPGHEQRVRSAVEGEGTLIGGLQGTGLALESLITGGPLRAVRNFGRNAAQGDNAADYEEILPQPTVGDLGGAPSPTGQQGVIAAMEKIQAGLAGGSKAAIDSYIEEAREGGLTEQEYQALLETVKRLVQPAVYRPQ